MLGAWSDRFEQALVKALLRRLGVPSASDEDDRRLAATLMKALATREFGIDRIFFDWRGGRDPGEATYASAPFRELAKQLDGRIIPQSHPYWSEARPCSMHIEEVEAIWSAIAEHDDWQPFADKVTAVRRMGKAMEQDARAG
jgi:uncharacterized protein YdiU (UPF0061 family)